MKRTNGKEKPAIVFDFGGVLLDWNPRYLYRKLFADDADVEQFLAEISFMEWNHLQDSGRTYADAVDDLCARHPERCELIRAYDERYLESISGAIEATVGILRRLHESGYDLYGLSNFPAEKFALVRPGYAFFAWFKAIIISGEVGVAKPDSRIFALLLERVGRPAQECLLIDDALPNIEVARKLGFQTILFQSPEQLEEELRNQIHFENEDR